MNRLFYIDFLRFWAILSVTGFHTARFLGFENLNSTAATLFKPLLMQGGWSGVCLFFFISGYCLCLTYKENTPYYEFLTKKFLKILPVYYAAMLIWFFLIKMGICIKPVGIFDTITHLLLIHNLFPATFYSFSGVFWFLGTLFDFYLLFPFLYKICKSSKIKAFVSAIIALLAVFIINSKLHNLVLDKCVFVYMPCFTAGILLNLYEIKLKQYLKILILAGSIMLLLFAKSTQPINVLAIFQTILFGGSIIICKDTIEKIPEYFKNFISKIAAASFSIYLYNYIFNIAMPHIKNFAITLIMTAMVFGFGIIMYYLIEKPYNKILKNRFNKYFR